MVEAVEVEADVGEGAAEGVAETSPPADIDEADSAALEEGEDDSVSDVVVDVACFVGEVALSADGAGDGSDELTVVSLEAVAPADEGAVEMSDESDGSELPPVVLEASRVDESDGAVSLEPVTVPVSTASLPVDECVGSADVGVGEMGASLDTGEAGVGSTGPCVDSAGGGEDGVGVGVSLVVVGASASGCCSASVELRSSLRPSASHLSLFSFSPRCVSASSSLCSSSSSSSSSSASNAAAAARASSSLALRSDSRYASSCV